MDSMSSGVSIGQAQYSVCQYGIRGGQKVSDGEREAACREFQQITGISISPPDTSPNLAIIGIAAASGLAIGIVLGYLLSGLSNRKKSKKL